LGKGPVVDSYINYGTHANANIEFKKARKDMWISELLNFIFALFKGKRK